MKKYVFFSKSRGLATCLLIVFSALSTHAQKIITGVLKDAQTGEVLIGANIVSKENPASGTISDVDGAYQYEVAPGTTTLVFSYAGYASTEELINGRNVVNVSLSPGQVLEDVVIIGYGSVKREDATGSVQSVSSMNFNRGAITGPQELLAGKVAGVAITTDGSPGGGAKIRIRGESSLSASNNPLIVIDGVPLDDGGVNGSRNPLNIINPNDIETFTVLKDASAAAIYGNRASGGVILITTKKGQLGKKVKVSYNANVSLGRTANRVDVLTADEFRDVVTNNTFMKPDLKAKAVSLLDTVNTDWQDQIYQQALATDHNLSVAGGIGSIPYRVSVGYTDKDGLLKTDNFNRISTGINLTPGFLDNRLQVKAGLKTSLSKNHFADRGAIGSALSFSPTKPVYNTTGRFGGYEAWTLPNGNPNSLASANPLALLMLRDDNSTVNQYIANTTVDYRFKSIPDLRMNLNLAYDYSMGKGTLVIPDFASFAFDEIYGGGINNRYEQTKKNSLLEFYMDYKRSLGKHTFELMGGYSWQRFYETFSYKNTNAKESPEKTEQRDNVQKELYLLAFFGRLQYDFNNRFLLYFTLRNDGTSRFSPESRWGLFPAAAAALKIIDTDRAYMNNLKLRVGYGVTGQQNLGGNYYPYIGQYQLGLPNSTYQLGDDFIQTLRANGYSGDLRWEETATLNLGLDFSLVKDRIGGTIEAYRRNTTDLLNYIPLPALSNLSNQGDVNIGTMETKGIELTLNLTPVKTKNIEWNLTANAAYNISEITKLTISDDSTFIGQLTGGIAGGVGSNIQIHSVGYRPASFYVYQQLYDENGKLLEGKYADRNGDNVVNDLDKYRYENPSPYYIFGITNNLRICQFDLSFAGRANLGNFVYNNVQTDMGYLNRIYGTTNYLTNVHQSAVDLNVLDQAKLTFSDHFVREASFFRVDHITAGYNITGMKNIFLRLYATVQNPFVMTNYDGLDPEIGNGIDNNIYPRPRTYLFGISLDF
ncbi:MAG: SusC/RagA family TonB-linked outer membrane protein [Saprospiraceae bacterium]|nr:SusC/RagA family TonB-linked outer membrane protein [Saprospiraceae bacterium]